MNGKLRSQNFYLFLLDIKLKLYHLKDKQIAVTHLFVFKKKSCAVFSDSVIRAPHDIISCLRTVSLKKYIPNK